MPFKSQKQMRLFFAKEKAGELPKGTARRWAHETKDAGQDLKKLPEKVKKKPSFDKVASVIWNAFIKEALDGTNSATAMDGAGRAAPKPGELKVPKRKIIGTARGFDPRASVDGLKSIK